MKLYDLVNSMTIQGNIEVAVFDADGSEKDRHFIRNSDDLCYDDIDDFEDLKVTFMFPNKSCDGTVWLNIEVQEEE